MNLERSNSCNENGKLFDFYSTGFISFLVIVSIFESKSDRNTFLRSHSYLKIIYFLCEICLKGRSDGN